MVEIIGKYQHDKSENLEEYFRTLGVPFVARKMMGLSNPILEISKDGDLWTMKNITLIRTQVLTFTMGVEYDEILPSGDVLKCTSTLENDSIITISVYKDGNKVTRRYGFSDDGITLTMSHEQSDQIAKRYFKRVI